MANPLDFVTEDQSGGDLTPFDQAKMRGISIRPTGSDVISAGGDPLTKMVAPEPPTDIMAIIQQVRDRLLGMGGQERYQMWPERMVRSGLTLPGDVMSGKEPMSAPGLRRGDFTDQPAPQTRNMLGLRPSEWQPGDTVVERAQDVAGLAGGSALIERPGAATLGSGPVRGPGMSEATLRPAIKYNGKVFKGNKGQDHLEVGFPKSIWDDVIKQGLEDPRDLPGMETGFIDHKGHFLDHSKAGEYAVDNGLINKRFIDYHGADYIRNGGLTTDMLRSDTQQPGAAISGAAGSAPVFYSALEHAATNAAQETMSPQQWLGYLKNQPGVKQEELAWTGIGDWLAGQKGKVKKEDVQAYLDEHKVEIKDVTKSGVQGFPDQRALEDAVETRSYELQEDFRRDHGRSPRDQEQGEIWDQARQEVEAVPQDHDVPTEGTKYSSYQLPGGENYREHLLTLPERAKVPVDVSQYRIEPNGEHAYRVYKGNEYLGGGPRGGRTDAQLQANWADKSVDAQVQAGANDYRSSHWDEPNVLAHVRTNDRWFGGDPQRYEELAHKRPIEKGDPGLTRAEQVEYEIVKPVKSLHIEEIQSDWHQQGRKQGYREPPKPIDKAGWTVKTLDEHPITGQRKIEILDAEGNRKSVRSGFSGTDAEAIAQSGKLLDLRIVGVPDAPFKTTWPELALKRMIRHAAENGYDRISWTPGEAQAARYDLSKSIESLKATPIMDQHGLKYEIRAKGHGGTSEPINSVVTEAELVNTVGKEMAQKIVDRSGGKKPVEFKGLDLKVGGEGMREFYDKMLPKMAEKIGKAHGVKVKQTELPGKYSDVKITGKDGSFYLEGPSFARHTTDDAFKTREAAQKALNLLREKDNPVHYFDIPQSLRDHAIGKGFPLYMSGIPFPLTPVDHDPFKKKE